MKRFKASLLTLSVLLYSASAFAQHVVLQPDHQFDEAVPGQHGVGEEEELWAEGATL